MAKPMCVHCGIREGVTDDHVFPKCFFAKPRPDNLPTVPSCQECNTGQGDGGDRPMSEDEEYTRLIYTISDLAQDHPTVNELLDGPVHRSLDRNPNLEAMILNTIQVDTVTQPDGTERQRLSFEHNQVRIARALKKMVRGLHYYEWKQPVPKDYTIEVHLDVSREMFELASNLINNGQTRTGPRTLGGTTVAYKGSLLFPGQPDSQWLILLYEKIGIIGSVHRGDLRDLPQSQVIELINGPKLQPLHDRSPTKSQG